MVKNKQIPEGYKDTPVGVIPVEWEVKKLGEVCSKIGDGIHGTPRYVDNSDFYFINGNNLIEGNIIINDDTKCVDFDEYMKYKKTLNINTILLSINGTIGKVGIYRGEKVILGKSAAYLVVPQPELYYYYLLQSSILLSFFEKELSGSTIKNLSLESIKKTNIPLPPLPEQKKIAEILTVWDEAIEKQSQLVEKLNLKKRGLMQQLLTGKKRLKGFRGEWKEYKLKHLFERVEDINDNKSAYPVLTISARQGFVSQNDKFDRVIAGGSLSKYTLIRKNDFAYNKGNSKLYKMGCIYQYDSSDFALVPFVYICFRSTGKVCADFYKHWFINHGLDRQLKKIITSGARGDGLLNVNKDDFFRLRVPYLPIPEQTAIAEVLTAADKEIALAQAKLEKLRQQKKGLMQQLLTGKKRVSIN